MDPKCNHECPYKRESEGDFDYSKGNMIPERGHEQKNIQVFQKLEKTRKLTFL